MFGNKGEGLLHACISSYYYYYYYYYLNGQQNLNTASCIFILYSFASTKTIYVEAQFHNYYLITPSEESDDDDLEIFPDCPNCELQCTSTLFETLRPDIAIRYKRDLYVIELTVPYETNCKIARRRKQEKYRDLRSQLLVPCEKFKLITLEITTLGFVTKNIRKFCRLCRSLNLQDNRIIVKCMEVALRATFYIFCRRNKNWTCPELLNFY